jgi:hypothetical protein
VEVNKITAASMRPDFISKDFTTFYDGCRCCWTSDALRRLPPLLAFPPGSNRRPIRGKSVTAGSPFGPRGAPDHASLVTGNHNVSFRGPAALRSAGLAGSGRLRSGNPPVRIFPSTPALDGPGARPAGLFATPCRSGGPPLSPHASPTAARCGGGERRTGFEPRRWPATSRIAARAGRPVGG